MICNHRVMIAETACLLAFHCVISRAGALWKHMGNRGMRTIAAH
jgi:hypothetical protein